MKSSGLDIQRLRQAKSVLSIYSAVGRLRNALKYNPNWALQPRVAAGHPEGGRWTTGLLGTLPSLLPALQKVGIAALRRLRDEGRRIAPYLRRVPRPWDRDAQPSEEEFDKETRRIGPPSWQRFGHPTIRFRNEAELRRYLGPAGEGREWHHIVEKRLAGRDGFPPELIHNTDNIISLPKEVHRRISARMSARWRYAKSRVRRYWLAEQDFRTQCDHGLRLIEEVLRELGYDPTDYGF